MDLRRLPLALAAGLLLAGPLSAADDKTGPAITAQAKSIDELKQTVRETARHFVSDETMKQFDAFFMKALDPKMLRGLGTTRPFGLYAAIEEDLAKSTVVLLIPTGPEKEFLALLDRMKIKAEPQKQEGLYALTVPDVQVPVFLKFANEYANISIGSSGPLEAKRLLNPTDVMTVREPTAAAIRIFIERVPLKLREQALGFLEKTLTDSVADSPPQLKELLAEYTKWVMRIYRQGLTQGREALYLIDLDPKTGLLNIDFRLIPQPGTELAKSIENLKIPANPFAGLVGKDSAGYALLTLPLISPELRKVVGNLIEQAEKQAAQNAPPPARELVDALLKGLRRTLVADELAGVASMRGPDADGTYTAIAAVRFKDTSGLQKALRGLLKMAPEGVKAVVKLDAHKVGDVAVHEIDLSQGLPPPAQKVFGKGTAYVAFAPDAVLATFGPKGLDLMKEGMTAKPFVGPLFHMEVSVKRLLPIMEKFDPQSAKNVRNVLNPNLDRVPLLTADVQGGKMLRTRAGYNVSILFGFVTTRAVSAPAAPPPPAK